MQNQQIQNVKNQFQIIGNSAQLNRAIEVALQVAPTDLNVLITGESGVGKENFSKIIHNYSKRKHANLFTASCGALPEGTINSELFGHEKGAFTGATGERKGYFETADGGTIFLDEVGELPLSTQAQLLRVLESGEFIRMGSTQIKKTNVRVIAATNLDIPRAIREGRFREDLYYRLNTVEIKLPPLRERKEDIPLLFRKFALDFAQKYNMPEIRLNEDAVEMLKSYYWQGNVRQLLHVVEQMSVIETSRLITKEILCQYLPVEETRTDIVLAGNRMSGDEFMNERELLYKVLFEMKRDMTEMRQQLNDLMQNAPEQRHTAEVAQQPTVIRSVADNRTAYEAAEEVQEEPVKSMKEIEKENIIRALEQNNGNRKLTAAQLNIAERTFYRKLKQYGL